MPSVLSGQAKLRIEFFEYIFGESVVDVNGNEKAYVCLASTKPLAPKSDNEFKQQFFEWPHQSDEVAAYLSRYATERNVYFCATLLSEKRREKKFCLPGITVWADLDFVDPREKDIPPSLIVETSPNRFQAFWRLDSITDPDVLEDLNRRVTYHLGADKSGWDLTQLLRVPTTTNFKYVEQPKVEVVEANDTRFPRNMLLALPDPGLALASNGSSIDLAEAMPAIEKLPPADQVIYKYANELRRIEGFSTLFAGVPEERADWSKLLWRLINICIEAGMAKEEVFATALDAKCNKYKRDNRPDEYLWREVLKAWLNQKHVAVILDKEIIELAMPQLVDREVIPDSFVNEYLAWGAAVTDAPPQYHELSCFIALSALVSGGLSIELGFGELVPHLWGMILGESTLTRKTTAMRMAMDIVTNLDEELILAHDGSPEGILSQISLRPRKVSIFYRDEIAGMFESFVKKDYMAGLAETFTLLYDVPKRLPRVLRKETIVVSEPYFIFFGGGIRDRVHSLLTEDLVTGGFIPRFLIVSGENDMSSWRPMGPPTQGTEILKEKVINSMGELKVMYNLRRQMEAGGQNIELPFRIKAKLTPQAWEYSAECERRLTTAAAQSHLSTTALPTFQRMAVSLLKMGTLIAATRREYIENELVVDKKDLEQAAWYIQRWGKYTIELISQAGKPQTERIIERTYQMIYREPGILKSDLMRRLHLTSRELKDTIDTLMDRGQIDASRAGQGTRYTSIL